MHDYYLLTIVLIFFMIGVSKDQVWEPKAFSAVWYEYFDWLE